MEQHSTDLQSKPMLMSLGWFGENILKKNIQKNEAILLKAKGTFGQALILTNTRVYILKWGLMTNNLFGSKCITYEYINITGVNVKKGMLTGAFEVLSPATQQSNKGYWSMGKNKAAASDNIITFSNDYGKSKAFQQATNTIRELINKRHKSAGSNGCDLNDLEKLAGLRDKGIISEDEFIAKKKQILNL